MYNIDNIHLSKGTLDDFNTIIDLYRQLWEEWDYDEEKVFKIFKEDLDTGRKDYLIASVDKNVVGVCSIYYKDDLHRYDSAILDELVVDREYRNRGVGGRLLQEALNIVKGKKCNFITLDSSFKREDAHRFYEKRGFERRGYYFKKIFNK